MQLLWVAPAHLLLLCSVALLQVLTSQASASTVVGFYSKTCPRAESLILAQVRKKFLVDKSITPALLRMLFHDAFVRGADASVLLDSKPGHPAEKDALPNLTLRGFDVIDAAKKAVESVCPGVVSCADILAMATRDAVSLAGGPRYDVPTGRLDGKVSIKEEALNLPSPAFPVEQSRESFFEKGLDAEDMVALLGAHTVGVALCGFFNDRLFNFRGTGGADPNMNPVLAARLSTVCPNPFFTESDADPPINLDQATPALFDSAYYHQLVAGNGILQIDQEIIADPSTASHVRNFTSPQAFFPAFVKSIIKMANIGVITGSSPLGEVRFKCNVSNGHVHTSGKPAAPARRQPATKSRLPVKPPVVPVPLTGHGRRGSKPKAPGVGPLPPRKPPHGP
ncbi:hypothetical protein GOP47_0017947 [Adiantum capillus-veneris]|uniref:Peroxidase n=1 Tax=Adiantum capillus-veneris TaxID=13818 RepID=A0A9D4ZA64_ADICA|nr:hypothetical protein GOP47_0017947 [Adiantum capillus-veneris]